MKRKHVLYLAIGALVVLPIGHWLFVKGGPYASGFVTGTVNDVHKSGARLAQGKFYSISADLGGPYPPGIVFNIPNDRDDLYNKLVNAGDKTLFQCATEFYILKGFDTSGKFYVTDCVELRPNDK